MSSPLGASLKAAHARFQRLTRYRHDDFCDHCRGRIFEDQQVSVRQTKELTLMLHRDCPPVDAGDAAMAD